MPDAPSRLDLRQHQEAFATWRQAQFPNATISGTLRHLRGEIEELAVALERRGDPEASDPCHGVGAELADCLNLLCSLAGFAGVDLEAAVEEKWAIVRERQYRQVLPPVTFDVAGLSAGLDF
jgi:NTP pyrophosphatase (non-canonical NTP hydrolase)